MYYMKQKRCRYLHIESVIYFLEYIIKEYIIQEKSKK